MENINENFNIVNNDNEVNPEEIKKSLEDTVKEKAGIENADLSKCSIEELEALLVKSAGISESIDIIFNNFDKYDEKVCTKALMDRYGFLEDEASCIYESISSDIKHKQMNESCICGENMTTSEFYDKLDKANEDGFIPSKYAYEFYEDSRIIPTSKDDYIERAVNKDGKSE